MEPETDDSFVPRDYAGPTGGMVMNQADCLSYLDWAYERFYGQEDLHREDN